MSSSSSPSSSAPIDVSSLAQDSKSKYESKIIAVLSSAIEKSSPVDQVAEKAASEIDQLYPGSNSEAEDFLWSFWTVLVNLAKKIPAQDDRQRLLVQLVAGLVAKRDDEAVLWRQVTRVWTEVPMLGPVMRDTWNLSPDFDGSEKDNVSVQEWISLNSFAARLYGAGLQDWHNFAVWEFRAGLETPPEDRPNARDTRIATAYEWIVHAGKRLYSNCKQVRNLDAHEQRALRPGILFKADKPGLTTERWNFWRDRLGVLGGTAGSGAAKEKAQRTLEEMAQISEGDVVNE